MPIGSTSFKMGTCKLV